MPSAKDISDTISRDGADIARSFVAGGLYMAFIAGAALGTWTVVSQYAPVVAQEIAPHRFPVYAADKLARVERLQANRWDAQPDTVDTVSKVATVDPRDLALR